MLSKNLKSILAVLWSSSLYCSLLYSGSPSEQIPREGSLARLAYEGKTSEIKAKIAQCPSDLNALDNCGLTPLQEAVCQHHAATVDCLCKEKTIDINVYSRKGLAALHYAVEGKQCSCNGPIMCASCKIIARLLGCNTLQVDKPKHVCFSFLTYLPHVPFYTIPYEEGMTALHIAAARGDTKTVKLLTERNPRADVNKRTYWRRTPLHYASLYQGKPNDAVQIIRTLYENEARFNAEDYFGFTPLHMAISRAPQTNSTVIVKALLERGADINNASPQKTPLMFAVDGGKIELVKFLINQGANTALPSSAYGITALDLAINNNFVDAQKILLACNAPYTISLKRLESLTPKRQLILYPLHEAADTGNLIRLKKIMDPKNHFSGYYTDTDDDACLPLHYAARNGHAPIVGYLVENTIDINAPDKQNKTALYYTVENKHVEAAQRILDCEPRDYLSGATDAPGVSIGESLLNVAAEKHCEEMALTLVRHGAKTANQHIFLWAISHNFQTIVEDLIEKGPKKELFEFTNTDKQTALDIAAEIKDEQLISLLIREGALMYTTPERIEKWIKRADKKISDLIDIESIVTQNRQPDRPMRADSVSLQAEELKTLNLLGSIQPSLQQSQKQSSYQYSVYYAIFNATRIAEDQYYLAGNLFSNFFKAALTFAQKNHVAPPYNYVTEEQTWTLIQEIKNNPELFSVDSKTDLNNVAIISFNRNKGFMPNAIKNCEAIERFINKSISHITIIMNSKEDPDHWITIAATREKDGERIVFKIYDSGLTLEEWRETLLLRICCSCIIPLQLMLSTTPENWQSSVDKVLENEIIEYALLFPQSTDQALQILLNAFDNFTKYLEKLYSAISDLPPTKAIPQHVQEIINTLRFEGLARAHRNLAHGITTYQKELNSELKSACGSFLSNHAYSIQLLQQQFSFIAHTPGQMEKKMQFIGDMLKQIPQIIEDAITLKDKLSQDPNSLLKNESFYEARTEAISSTKLELIKQHLQPEIRTILQDLTTKSPEVETMLFYGAPGNGKTTIAQAMAQLCPFKDDDGELKARPFHIVRVPALGTEYQFSKQKQLAALNTYINANSITKNQATTPSKSFSSARIKDGLLSWKA